ncbi:Flagellum site-determining protein YlxH [Posidoniimonas polymericola]|uniref:Flagellum site-determining protein YlxH n=1 Tax=Posidoniimonas polymericola TaxID=2528002 RepID=A0A5C5XSU7_9BACT|nr:AAA family ATPase [Posidoniimonas polymericola]TWT65403.1 Flagellum site-determining protein YlxH [Posidoniimonas polymericola]
MNQQARLSQDQAVALRQLVRAARVAAGQPVDAPIAGGRTGGGRMIVVAGAKGGVGATTVSLMLARALAESGEPTLLVDANLRQADLAQLTQAPTSGRPDLADVLSGSCRTAEARIDLGNNLSLLPGAWAPAAQPDANADAVGRWLEDLAGAVSGGEHCVLDVGVGMKPWTEPLWRRACRVALVTTPDKLSVLDAYAAAKLARGEGVDTEAGLLVNRATDAPAAQGVHRRVEQTCQRFLGAAMPMLGWAPDDPRCAIDPMSASTRYARTWTHALIAPGSAARAA